MDKQVNTNWAAQFGIQVRQHLQCFSFVLQISLSGVYVSSFVLTIAYNRASVAQSQLQLLSIQGADSSSQLHCIRREAVLKY